jgi:hypothetical protein
VLNRTRAGDLTIGPEAVCARKVEGSGRHMRDPSISICPNPSLNSRTEAEPDPLKYWQVGVETAPEVAHHALRTFVVSTALV